MIRVPAVLVRPLLPVPKLTILRPRTGLISSYHSLFVNQTRWTSTSTPVNPPPPSPDTVESKDAATPVLTPAPIAKPTDTAKLVFNQVWSSIEKEIGGKQNIRLPHEIIWLMGSPGSGKGTNTPAILRARGITNPPIVVGKLLMQSKVREILDRGEMVGDKHVLELLLRELMKADPAVGVLVDGFPRTEVQVECLKLLHEKMQELRSEFFNTALRDHFRRPIFRITVLFVEEDESIKRQLKRGMRVREHNTNVERTGQGTFLEERPTDFDEKLIKARYKIFTQHYGALMRLKKLFPFHLINAEGPIEDVIRLIWREFEYQSSLELDTKTYDAIQMIPIASKIGIHARQDLVRRLESYQLSYPDKLQQCVRMIREQFIPVIQRHAISGVSVVRIQDKQLENPILIDIIMDVLSERGFAVSVDRRSWTVPVKVNPDTWDIISETRGVFMFEVRSPQLQIRGVFEGLNVRSLVGDVAGTEVARSSNED